MKKTSKLILFAMVLFAVIFIPNLCKAETKRTVNNAEEFATQINQAETGDTIDLAGEIKLTGPIGISGKSITINGNGRTISRDESWTKAETNATLITAGQAGTTVTLNDVTLKGSLKYGVQAYNGGRVVLNDVTISDCAYAGVLVNGGTIEIIDLTLGHNHTEDENVGIEIGMGKDVKITPKVVMNGAINTKETENVIYIAEDDELTGFEVDNTDSSKQKIFVQGNQIVVTDDQNKVLFTSNSTDVDIEGTTFVENKTVTVYLNDNTFQFAFPKNTILTKEELEIRINIATLNLSNFEIVGYYTSADYTTAFNFDDPITEDTSIYAKLNDTTPQTPASQETPPKDVTPKTGDSSYINIAIAVVALSVLGIALLKRKEF